MLINMQIKYANKKNCSTGKILQPSVLCTQILTFYEYAKKIHRNDNFQVVYRIYKDHKSTTIGCQEMAYMWP